MSQVRGNIQPLPPSILDRVSSWGEEITRHRSARMRKYAGFPLACALSEGCSAHVPVKTCMCVADVGESGPIGEGRTIGPQKAT